jgi:hypothetical protein
VFMSCAVSIECENRKYRTLRENLSLTLEISVLEYYCD